MKRTFLSLVATIILAFSFNSFTLVSETETQGSGVYIEILDGNSYEFINTTGIAEDSWRFKVTFYDANGNVLETERYSGDDFNSIINACPETPANCATVKAYLWARLIDDSVFTDTKIHQSDC